MTKRERFMNFIANKPVDRVPVALFHHFLTPDLFFTGLDNPEAFEANIEGHRKAREIFDPDVIKIMNDSLMVLPLDTSFVTCAADLRKLTPPMPGSAFFEKTKELTKRCAAVYEGSDAPIYATGFSPSMVLRTSLANGFEVNLPLKYKPRLVEFLEEDPDSVVAGLELISTSIKALNEMLIRTAFISPSTINAIMYPRISTASTSLPPKRQ